MPACASGARRKWNFALRFTLTSRRTFEEGKMAKTRHQSRGVADVNADKARPIKQDSDLRPEAAKPSIEPDDIPNREAAREVTRLKKDDYLVKPDLEDADQRNPLPDMKDQD